MIAVVDINVVGYHILSTRSAPAAPAEQARDRAPRPPRQRRARAQARPMMSFSVRLGRIAAEASASSHR